MVMNLMVENVPEGSMMALRVKAASEARTVRAVVLEWLEWIADGEQGGAAQAPAVVEKPGAVASPRRRSSLISKPRATKQAVSSPRRKMSGSRPPADRETPAASPAGEVPRCPHGLTWHPGCNA